MFRYFFVVLVLFFAGSVVFAYDQIRFYDGKELYKQCISCHGEFGEKQTMGKSGEISTKSESGIASILKEYAKSDSVGAMQSQAALLNDDKIRSLAYYISIATVKRGEELYDAKCFGCHGAYGEKEAFGKSGKISELSELQIQELLNAYKSGGFLKNASVETMQRRALNLSEHDIKAIARYISTIK